MFVDFFMTTWEQENKSLRIKELQIHQLRLPFEWLWLWYVFHTDFKTLKSNSKWNMKYVYCIVITHCATWCNVRAKLYIPSTLNIDLILWQTQLIVCAENVKSWVFPFTFQAYILPHTLNCVCVSLFKFHIWILEQF